MLMVIQKTYLHTTLKFHLKPKYLLHEKNVFPFTPERDIYEVDYFTLYSEEICKFFQWKKCNQTHKKLLK